MNDKTAIDFEFGAQTLAEKQAQVRDLLSHLAPKNADDVRMVAACLKTHGADLEDVFLDWAKPFGRYKAKGLWHKTKADPDAMEEVIQRQIAARDERSRFHLIDERELEATPNIQWAIQRLFPTEGVVSIYGASGSGKGFVVIDMGCALAEGEPFFGYRTKQRPVLYVALEGAAGIKGRMRAWKTHRLRERLPEGLRILLPTLFRITDERDVHDLAAVTPRGCVTIIDTLNRAAPNVDENSSRDMGAVLEGAKLLQQLTEGLVVLVAHIGKDAAKGVRGHSSMFAALDAAILISRDFDRRRLRVDKAKDGADGIEHHFRLHVVPLGEDEFGDAVTSCVVVPDDSAKRERAIRPLTANQELGLKTFNAAAREAASSGVHLNNWRKAFYSASPADNDEAKRKAFHRARADLVELEKLSVKDNVYRIGGENAAIAEQCMTATLGHRTPEGLFPDKSRVAPVPCVTDRTHSL